MSIPWEATIIENFECLYQALYGELVDYFEHRLPDPTQAEDFTQQTFEQLLGAEEVILYPTHYARKTAANLLKNEYRDTGVEPGIETEPREVSYDVLIGRDGEGLDHLAQFQTSSLDDVMFHEEHDAGIRDLDEALRDAYILGELRGLPSREAALLLGVSHVTAIARRESATSAIREEIAA